MTPNFTPYKNNPALLEKTIEACEDLVQAYASREGLKHCPLCVVVSDDCNNCPWVTLNDARCVVINSGSNPSIGYMRLYPNEYPEQADQAIIRINRWLTTLTLLRKELKCCTKNVIK